MHYLHGIWVCKDAGPNPFGGGAICKSPADIGATPITPPLSLMCSTDLTRAKGTTVGIQILYGRRLIRNGTYRQADSKDNYYVTFNSRDVKPRAGADTPLPRGRYRCRFLANGRVVRSRTIVVS